MVHCTPMPCRHSPARSLRLWHSVRRGIPLRADGGSSSPSSAYGSTKPEFRPVPCFSSRKDHLMKFATFKANGTATWGLIDGEDAVDLGTVLQDRYPDLKTAIAANALNEA